MVCYDFLSPRNADSDSWANVFDVGGSGSPGRLDNTNVGNTSTSSAVRPVSSLDISNPIDNTIVE